jgi:signal transduction histidine kinase
VVYVCATLPVVTVVGGLAHGQAQYITAFAVLGSGIYTTPAAFITWLAFRRATAYERWYWAMWLGGLVLIYSTGLGMLVGVLTRWHLPDGVGMVTVTLVAALFTFAVAGLVRQRSGRRALSVDLTEWLMSVVVVAAPAALLWGDTVVSAKAAWFTIPAAVAMVGTVSGSYWAVVLYVRLGPDRCSLEMRAVAIGLALAVLGLTNSVAQAAQGISGFTLPSAPLIGVHAACMSLLLLVPLHMPTRRSAGLNRLPPQAQLRGAGMAALVTLAGLPVIVAVTLIQRDRQAWVPVFAFAVIGALLVLATLRQLAVERETRGLYSLVEKAAADRRDLIAQMIQRIDDDRHAVAAQLHEQAMSAYATFVSFMQATVASSVGQGQQGPVNGASALIRDDLSRQAESLRQLMVAIRPLEADRPRSESLRTPVTAYLDSLYGDRRAPQLDVVMDPHLVLDWITETIAFRIVQEALHNVRRHSEATRVEVSLRAAGDVVEVRVEDDGVGFDPDASLFESGIDAMRSFAAFANGRLEVEAAPGEGTVVVAHLGDSRSIPRAHAAPEPRLRLV